MTTLSMAEFRKILKEHVGTGEVCVVDHDQFLLLQNDFSGAVIRSGVCEDDHGIPGFFHLCVRVENKSDEHVPVVAQTNYVRPLKGARQDARFVMPEELRR